MPLRTAVTLNVYDLVEANEYMARTSFSLYVYLYPLVDLLLRERLDSARSRHFPQRRRDRWEGIFVRERHWRLLFDS